MKRQERTQDTQVLHGSGHKPLKFWGCQQPASMGGRAAVCLRLMRHVSRSDKSVPGMPREKDFSYGCKRMISFVDPCLTFFLFTKCSSVIMS